MHWMVNVGRDTPLTLLWLYFMSTISVLMCLTCYVLLVILTMYQNLEY